MSILPYVCCIYHFNDLTLSSDSYEIGTTAQDADYHDETSLYMVDCQNCEAVINIQAGWNDSPQDEKV